MSELLTVEVRLFAQLRVAAGADRLQRQVAPGTTARALARALLAELELGALSDRIVVALDDRYADPGTVLRDGDRLSLVPPVSGGSAQVNVLITEAPLDASAVLAATSSERAGAAVLFQGTPRDVDALEFEAHATLAEAELRRIGEELASAHQLTAISLHHRLGRVPSREAAILIAASSPRRDAAFTAARAALEEIKRRVPLWKSELRGAARTAVDGEVVRAAPVVGSGAAIDAPAQLTHVAADGSARMVDVTEKAVTDRLARAGAEVHVSPQTAQLIADGSGPKGEVLAVARLAGTMAAKRTAELVPLAHPLPLTKIDVQATVDVPAGVVRIESLARTTGKTGVEIEALVAASVAALTVYDMVKAVERHAVIGELRVLEKRGGRHDFGAEQLPAGLRPAAPTPGPLARAAEPALATTPSPAVQRPPLRVAALLISTSRSDGTRADHAAAALASIADAHGWLLAPPRLVPDDRAQIAAALQQAADPSEIDAVLTLGGTGLTPDDVTPEATADVLDRAVPGLAEALRAASLVHTPLAALSRGAAGAIGEVLVVNLPGSPKALGELGSLLAAVLPHASQQLRRAGGDDGRPHR